MLSQQARFERFIAEMAWVIASGQHIDPSRVERFSAQVEEVYKNPFIKQNKMTAEAIKERLVKRLLEE